MSGFHLFQNVLRRIDPGLPIDDFIRTRTAGRLLEEAVELALSSGQSAKDVLGHVVDALHNEGKKFDCYPSQLEEQKPDKADILFELADVYLLLELIAFLNGMTTEIVRVQAGRKLADLEEQVQRGEMKIVGGLMYKKSSGR